MQEMLFPCPLFPFLVYVNQSLKHEEIFPSYFFLCWKWNMKLNPVKTKNMNYQFVSLSNTCLWPATSRRFNIKCIFVSLSNTCSWPATFKRFNIKYIFEMTILGVIFDQVTSKHHTRSVVSSDYRDLERFRRHANFLRTPPYLNCFLWLITLPVAPCCPWVLLASLVCCCWVSLGIHLSIGIFVGVTCLCGKNCRKDHEYRRIVSALCVFQETQSDASQSLHSSFPNLFLLSNQLGSP